MSSSCRRLDDVALWRILKSVDASTLQNCRRACKKWNGEICRLTDYTSKFKPGTLILELYGISFKISVGTPNNSRNFEEDPVSSITVERLLRHVDPPHTLLIFFNQETDLETYEEMMNGIKNDWISSVKELEITSHNCNLKFAKVLSHLKKTPNLTYLSISQHCNETISIGDIFKLLPELKSFRTFDFNSNNGIECSSGLIFDDKAVEQLLNNQKGFRKIQNIELFNTDIEVSMNTMTNALITLARLPLHPVLQNPKETKHSEDIFSVNLFFNNCRWNSIGELNLLASIIRISSQFNFPIPQPDEPVLKGDFRFLIFDTSFILNFMAG